MQDGNIFVELLKNYAGLKFGFFNMKLIFNLYKTMNNALFILNITSKSPRGINYNTGFVNLKLL